MKCIVYSHDEETGLELRDELRRSREKTGGKKARRGKDAGEKTTARYCDSAAFCGTTDSWADEVHVDVSCPHGRDIAALYKAADKTVKVVEFEGPAPKAEDVDADGQPNPPETETEEERKEREAKEALAKLNGE